MFYNQAISGNALEARRSESCVLLGFSGGAICRDGDKPEEHLARKPRRLLGTRLHNRSREQTQRTKVTSRTRKGLPPSTPVRGHPHASPRQTGDCQPNGLLGGTLGGALVWIYSSGDGGRGFHGAPSPAPAPRFPDGRGALGYAARQASAEARERCRRHRGTQGRGDSPDTHPGGGRLAKSALLNQSFPRPSWNGTQEGPLRSPAALRRPLCVTCVQAEHTC